MHFASVLFFATLLAAADGKAEPRKPLLRTVDLNIGDPRDVQFAQISFRKPRSIWEMWRK